MSTRRETFEVGEHAVVELRLSRADVHVVPNDTGSITVELGGRDPGQVTVEHVGSTVRVREESRRFRSSVSTATLHVPAGTRVEVDLASGDTVVQTPIRDARLRTASGDVQARELTGRAELRTASGDIRLGHVEDVSITCASGDVSIERVDGRCDVNSASGDVRLDDLRGDTTVRTASGDVQVGRLAARRLTVRSVSGDASIGVAQGRQVRFDFKSLSGSARTQPPEDVVDPDAPREPTEIVVTTVSGDLDLHSARA